MKKLFLLVLICFAAGCSTPYQSGAFSYTGGHYDKKVSDKLEKIMFSGNGYTEQSTAQQYALFRSAEYAKEHNKPYYFMYRSLIDAAINSPAKAPNIGSVGGKPIAFCYVLLLDTYQAGAIKVEDILAQIAKMKNEEQKSYEND